MKTAYCKVLTVLLMVGSATFAYADTSAPTLSAAELIKRYGDKLYKTYNFDVNADGLIDKIITHKNSENNFYQGDKLFVYLTNSEREYTLSLETINHTDEAGWFLDSIMPRADHSGFIISTFFNDRGHSNQLFYYENNYKNTWRVDTYISEGTLISADPYYCVVPQNSTVIDGVANISHGKSSYYSETEFKKYCPPPPRKYKVNSDKLEILNLDFQPQSPNNYYIQGDEIAAFSQNEDWVKVAYKNGSKYGWVNKKYLLPILAK